MNNWLRFYGFGLGLIFVAISTQAADTRVAVVNISTIFQQMPQKEAIIKNLEKEFKPREVALNNIKKEITNKLKKLQREAEVMKPSDRKKLEKEIAEERENFAKQANDFDKDNRARQVEERDKLLVKIQNLVTNIAKSKGYELVIDSSVVIYGIDYLDITDSVLKEIKGGIS